MVSQETRLSLPSRCSTTTKMVSGISSRFSVLGSRFSVLSSQLYGLSFQLSALGFQLYDLASLGGQPRRLSPHEYWRLQHSQFVAQFVDQLFGDFGWRAFDVFG